MHHVRSTRQYLARVALAIAASAACATPELGSEAQAIAVDGGAAAPTVDREPTPEKTAIGLFFPLNPTPRSTVIGQVGTLPTTGIGVFEPPTRHGASGGEHVTVGSLPPGHYAGSTGAGPCVIVIVTIWTANGPVFHVYHFQVGDDVSAALGALGDVPGCTSVALAGGDGSNGSNQLIQQVLNWVQAHNDAAAIDGYYDGPGLWVDADGNYHHHNTEAPGYGATLGQGGAGSPSGGSVIPPVTQP